MATPSEAHLLSLLSQLRVSDQYSDLILRRGIGCEFKVHQLIVCPQSNIIARRLINNFNRDHRGIPIVEIRLYDPSTVDKMVEFMYSAKYSTPVYGGDDASSQATILEHEQLDEYGFDSAERFAFDTLLNHMRVIEIGVTYEIPALVAFANKEIQAQFGDGHYSLNVLAQITEVASHMELKTQKGLWDILAATAATNLEELLTRPVFQKMTRMESPFCSRLFAACHESKKDATARLQAKCDDSDTKFAMERSAHDQTRAELVSKRAALDSIRALVEKLNKTDKCRNQSCRQTFSPLIELDTYVIRCRKCLCKH